MHEGELVVPHRVGWRHEVGHRIVEAAQQLGGRRQQLVGQRPRRERREGHVARDELPPFTAELVETERFGRLRESAGTGVADEGEDRLGVRARRAAYLVADPDDCPWVGHPTVEHLAAEVISGDPLRHDHPPGVDHQLAHLLIVDRVESNDHPVVAHVGLARHEELVRVGGDERLALLFRVGEAHQRLVA